MRCWIPHTGLNTNCRLKSLQGQRRLSYDLLDNSLVLSDKHEDLTDCHQCFYRDTEEGGKLCNHLRKKYTSSFISSYWEENHISATRCVYNGEVERLPSRCPSNTRAFEVSFMICMQYFRFLTFHFCPMQIYICI